MGPYDGLVGPSVDRIGRNVRDTLNRQAMLTEQGRIIVTADHAGVWDFSDPNQENEWLAKAWGSQMELRAIQKRNRDEAIRARKAGEPKQRPSYGLIEGVAEALELAGRLGIDDAMLAEAIEGGPLDAPIADATPGQRITPAWASRSSRQLGSGHR
jgi:DNA invertase Pin-like site-specific DNA recombinase